MVKQSPALLGGGCWIGRGPTPVPVDDFLPPPGGVGIPTRSNMMGEPVTDYPPGEDTPLEKMRWKNYQEKPGFSLFPSYEANRRMWQEIEVDRMMDHAPPHEIHPRDLPEYHYWPMIQNDVDPPRATKSQDCWQYHTDCTQIPRFHKNGVPKTPLQEQHWYLPRLADGRFDWKKNAIYNTRNLTAYCSETGWDNRYLRRIFRPWCFGRQASKASNVHTPIYFRHKELPTGPRMVRWMKGSYISTGFFFIPLYSGLLAYGGSTFGDYKTSYYSLDGPWNPDYTTLGLLARDKGMYHGLL